MAETIALFLYGIIGCFGAVGIGLFIGGYIVYLVRMGLDGRSLGVDLMTWGVTVMFVVLLCTVLLRFLI